MSGNAPNWKPIATTSALSCTYRFGSGLANAIAVPYDGGLAIVSPPCGVPEETFAEVEKHGRVRALVAPNAYHTLGLRPWKDRFPTAEVFAPAQSLARLAKQANVAGIQELARMKRESDVEFIDMPHYKTGEVLVRLTNGSDVAWCVTDVVMNLPKLPPSFPMKQLFAWTKSAPGLRPNWLASTFMMKDKRAVYRWLRDELEKAPPSILIAGHGDHITSGAAERLRACLPS